MFFKLRVIGDDCKKVSHIIVKHPENLFERNIKKRGKITARFEKYEDSEIIYSGYVENNSLSFIKLCKEENLPNYVNSEEYSVCPFNLACMDDTFRSVLRGSNVSDLSEEEYFKEYDIEFTIGPFSLYKKDWVVEVFESLDSYIVDVIENGLAYALKISGKNNITTFLQQIYVISYAITNHLRFRAPSLEGIDKFTNLSKNWIDDYPKRNLIVNKLSKIVRNVKHFETNLMVEDGVEKTEAEKKAKEILDNKKTKLSELRYNVIISLITLDRTSVLDFGCAQGNLIERLLKRNRKLTKLVGFDSNKKATSVARKRGLNTLRKTNNKTTKFKVIDGNIYYPDYELFEDMDVVVMSEIIEHFPKKDIPIILDIVFKGICPESVILTTPNKDYNSTLNLNEGHLRHPEHYFEFTAEDIKSFAKDIETKYNYSYLFYSASSLSAGIEPFNELSFVIHFDRGDDVKKDENFINHSINIYSPFDLDISGCRIKKRDIRIGSAASSKRIDHNWIISLAPTMSPANCSDVEGYLEHPSEAIDYYMKRGVYDLIWEVKHMGSRGTIVSTRNQDISRQLFNSEDVIKIYSRSGYNFFNEQEIVDDIHKEILSFMEYRGFDIVAFDCEILPWSYKAGVMIEKDFQKPADCSLMNKKFTGRDSTKEELFLKSLSNYNKKTNIKIYPFNTILTANLKGKRLINVENGYHINHQKQLVDLQYLCNHSKYFKNVDWDIIHLDKSNNNSVINSIFKKWKQLEENGFEGMVFKPLYPTQFLRDGRFIQPAIKCRTREYLRLIYGIDYLDDDNLKFLKKRKAGAKRKLAMQQYELTQKILYSFINGNSNNRLKYIFGFFGMERMGRIDATL